MSGRLFAREESLPSLKSMGYTEYMDYRCPLCQKPVDPDWPSCFQCGGKGRNFEKVEASPEPKLQEQVIEDDTDRILRVIDAASKALNKVPREDLEEACKAIGLNVTAEHTKGVMLALLKKKVAER